MKKVLRFLLLGCIGLSSSQMNGQTSIKVFDNVLYYDGYAALVSEPVSPGVIRLRNDLYSVKLTNEQLSSIGNSLTMNVTIKASCDNYDRIGNVNLALVARGAATYKPDTVERIEIGRYITPFMNKNKKPDTVPYNFVIDNVARLLKETSITAKYDIWVELEVFGVPYAANKEVAGCDGRNDVFYGSVEFVTDAAVAAEETNVLLPLAFKQNFNNYEESATDTIGKTRKTITFQVDSKLSDAMLFLITSNHGANQDGEEYARRNHFAYFDGEEVLTYKPGRSSCEPFRVYNTQGNNIYSPYPRSDAQWQSFSNWCPGDVITTRVLPLGPLEAGSHTFSINVPDAVFVDKQGNFPLSLYLQGKTSGTVLSVGHVGRNEIPMAIYPNPVKDIFTIDADRPVDMVSLFNLLGQKVFAGSGNEINVGAIAPGIYWVQVRFAGDIVVNRKLVKN